MLEDHVMALENMQIDYHKNAATKKIASNNFLIAFAFERASNNLISEINWIFQK